MGQIVDEFALYLGLLLFGGGEVLRFRSIQEVFLVLEIVLQNY